MKKSVTVYNLAEDTEETYVGLEPIEALISSALRKDGLHAYDPESREAYRNKIKRGQYAANIDDLVVRLPDRPKEGEA